MADDAGYWAFRNEVGAAWLPRDFVEVRGPDAIEYLQGQLSQELTGMQISESAWSFLLQPTGKVDAFVRVTRVGGDSMVLDCDRGWGTSVVARLNRFKLRIAADVAPLDGWSCLTIRGPRSGDVEVGGIHHRFDWPGLPGFDAIGSSLAVPDGAVLCRPDAWESVRVEAGVPTMGAEVDENTIPAELGSALLEKTVSFTKGCYTGQELVARIDSRGGHVPRRMAGLVVASIVIPPAGAVLRADGKSVGTLTSVAESPSRRCPVGLALVHRSVADGAAVTVAWDDDEVVASVEALPLVS